MCRDKKDLPVRAPRIRVEDVAARAGVSTTTARNALRRPHLVSTTSLSRVRKSAEALGYLGWGHEGHHAAHPRRLALLVSDSGNPVHLDMARDLQQRVFNAGHSLTIIHRTGVSTDPAYVSALQNDGVEGIFVPSTTDPAYLARLRAIGIAAVLVGPYTPGLQGHCVVGVSNHTSGQLVMKHFQEIGRRRIAFVGPITGHAGNRLAGAQDFMRGAGSDSIRLFPTLDSTVRSGEQAGKDIAYLHGGERPDGVFAANDVLALGLQRGFLRHNIRMPEDVALVGYDDIGFAVAAAVPLTSVRQPWDQIADRSVELLIDELDHAASHVHATIDVPTQLACRSSSHDLHPGPRLDLISYSPSASSNR